MKTERGIIAYLVLFLLFFMLAFFVNNCTGRSFGDGIQKAEMHHLLTGEYYNEYKIIDKDSSYIIVDKVATFDTIYWKDLNIKVIEK